MPTPALADNAIATPKDDTSAALDSFAKVSAPADTASSAASSASTGSVVSTDQPGSSTTATTAAAPITTSTSQPAKEAPEPRIKIAVENARKDLQAEHDRAIADLRKQFAWAEGVDQKAVAEAINLVRTLNTNPKGFLEQLQKDLQSTELTDPEPDLVSQDGKHRAYSVDLLKKVIANTEARVLQTVRNEFKPTVEYAQTARHSAEVAAVRQEALTFAQQAIGEIKAQPWFKPEVHGPLVMAKLNAMTPDQKLKLGGTYGALMRANQMVMVEEWPKLQMQTQADVEADNRRKAAASTGSVSSTNGTIVTTPKRLETIDDIADNLRQHFAAAGRTN